MLTDHPAQMRIDAIESEPAIDVAEAHLERIESMSLAVGSGFAAIAASVLWIALAA